jgi:hypothetical protein
MAAPDEVGSDDPWSIKGARKYEASGSMSIVFFCQSCGSRFDLDPQAAGKQGRCKKCGQRMAVPKAEEIASNSAMPALATVGVGAAAGLAQGPNWLERVTSQVGLAPITIDRMPARFKKPSMFAEDDLGDSKPYALAKPERRESGRSGASGPAGAVVRVWRGQLGGLQKLFRRINEIAYLISIPFLMMLLLGAVIRNRPMALFGAAVVVLLNVGRLISGAANLAVVPFRDGMKLKKMKKPLRRIIEPAITIGLVILAFTFIPWLWGSSKPQGNLRARVGASAQTMEHEVEGIVDKAAGKAKGLDLKKLGDAAERKLGELQGQARDRINKVSGRDR